MEEVDELIRDCLDRKWDKAMKSIAEDPRRLCIGGHENGHIPAYWAAFHGNLKMLEYMHKAVLSIPGCDEQMLQDAFMRKNYDGWDPAYVAVFSGHTDCFIFLTKSCPGILANLDGYQNCLSFVHIAAITGRIEILEHIVKNAPGGLRILTAKTRELSTPLEVGSKGVKNYFTDKKIAEIGYQKELEIMESLGFAEPGSFAELVFGIVRDTIKIVL